MSFPSKEERSVCWATRDRYWECLDQHQADSTECQKLRRLYQASCPAQWVKHFDRKRNYLLFKERIEKDAFEPIEQLKT